MSRDPGRISDTVPEEAGERAHADADEGQSAEAQARDEQTIASPEPRRSPHERTQPGFPPRLDRPPPLPTLPRHPPQRPVTVPPPPGYPVPDSAAPVATAVGDTTARFSPPPIPKKAVPKVRPATQPSELYSIRGVKSPLVGRERELDEMEEAVRRAVDFQAPQLITVAGTQGTGKSRLIDELIQLTAVPPVRVYRGRSSQGGSRYGAVSRLLRDRFGLGEGMDEDAVRRAVGLEVRRVFADERVGEVLHFLGKFLDFSSPESPFLRALGENPTQYEEVARTVLRRFIEIDASKSPLILVFDDLQWADDDTLVLLRELGAGMGGSPVVLIACGRGEFLVRFPDWGAGHSDHMRVDLRNLEPGDGAQMFRNLLRRCGEVPAEIVEDAVEMTGGNPQFLEQLVRLFLANGTIDASGDVWTLDPDRAADTDLPISVEEAIQARIAALAGPEREVLERGAVFGNVFWLGAAVALGRLTQAEAPGDDLDWSAAGDPVRRQVSEVLDELVERDYLLRMDPDDSTIAGDIELVFKHNLERELIATSTEARRLARYHRLAAQWLETKLTSRSEEQLEFLAQLYERGGDRSQAARFYLAGADKAMGRYANEQAVELYRKALELMGDEDVISRFGALHNLGSVLDLIGRGDEAAARFHDMLDLAWRFDHRAKGGAAHGRLARVHRKRGEYDRAMEHLRAAHDLFEQAGDKRGIAGTLDDIGKVHWLRGAYGQALEFHRQALALRRALGDRRSIALSLANIGRVHHDSGAFKAANRQFREALDLRRDIGDLTGVVQSLCDLADVHIADSGSEMALEMLTEAHQISTDIGDKLALCEVLARLGECRASLGRFEEARAHLVQAVELGRSLGHRVAIADASRRLAEVELALSDIPSAYDHAMEALAISESVGSRVQVGTAHRVLAEAIAVAGLDVERARRAENHFHQAVEILAGMKNELELARCYRAYAGFCEAVGKPADAAKLRLRADEIFGRLRGAANRE